ncbi:MAG: hypothetical protein MHPSP_003886, partial [Paramarteilia canceri]
MGDDKQVPKGRTPLGPSHNPREIGTELEYTNSGTMFLRIHYYQSFQLKIYKPINIQ